MRNKKKMAPGEVLAEMSYLEFFNNKGKLANGTYRVIEEDGEINYAVLGDFRGLMIFDLDWYGEDEYLAFRESDRTMDWSLEDNYFDEADREELMDSFDRAMRPNTDGMGDDCSPALLEAQAKKYPASEKTLGELLREQLNN